MWRTEVPGNVSAFTIDANTGALTPVGPPVATGGTISFSVTIDPTGEFAYVANFGSNNVSAFTIDPRTGALTAVGVPVTSGASPSSLAVEPTGRFAYLRAHSAHHRQVAPRRSGGSRTKLARRLHSGPFLSTAEQIGTYLDTDGQYCRTNPVDSAGDRPSALAQAVDSSRRERSIHHPPQLMAKNCHASQ